MSQFAVAAPDPFVFKSDLAVYQIWRATAGVTPRSQIINPLLKTLALISAGQSNWTNITPTLYTPTNASVVDQLNPYDGACYPIAAPLLGTSFNGATVTGNMLPRLADNLINNARFDRVIVVPIAVSATTIAQWGTGGVLSDRIGVAVARLASRGITAATTGVTMGFLWGQGESDTLAGTSQVAYAASLTQVLAQLTTAGFSGRKFICKETWAVGSVSAAVQAAQTAIIDNVTIFSGGDLDSLNATNRQADNTHFNDTGAAAAATLVYNAMHASGAPF